MKLSDAIREGSKNTKQCFNSFFGRNENESNCAMGAAAVGCGFDLKNNKRARLLWDLFPTLNSFQHLLIRTNDRCFKCGYEGKVADIIMHLNDQHQVSREAIAEWVEATFETGAQLVEDVTPTEIVNSEKTELVLAK